MRKKPQKRSSCPIFYFCLPSVLRMWLFSPSLNQDATSAASLFCTVPPSQVKPSWGLRGSTRSCTNCNMTSPSWRKSPFWWARCRACTRYATAPHFLPRPNSLPGKVAITPHT